MGVGHGWLGAKSVGPGGFGVRGRGGPGRRNRGITGFRGGDSSATSVGDRVFLTSGGTIQESGHMAGVIGKLKSQITVDMSLPLTAAEAVADGWTDPIFCSPGRGRYFQKGPAGEGEPFFLMYNGADELIGMYQFTRSETPTPWKRLDELRGGGGLTIIELRALGPARVLPGPHQGMWGRAKGPSPWPSGQPVEEPDSVTGITLLSSLIVTPRG